VNLFGRLLLEASESELQEFIDEAPQLFSTQPLALLRGCKALVDARLAAEPDKKVFYMSDPHEVRLRYWDKIAERLEAEINLRSGKSAEAARDSMQSTRGGDPEVGKRRSIVKGNRTKSAEELCKLFEFNQVCLPRDWQDDFSVRSWPEAYSNQKLKHAVQSLISRDKKATAKQ